MSPKSTHDFTLSETQRKQIFFDLTWATARQMSAPALVVETEYEIQKCFYRSPTNTSCFIGARIPDALYRPEMDSGNEGTSVGDMLSSYEEVSDYFHEQNWTVDKVFLTRLQSIHDQNFDNRFKELRDLATDYSLTAPALDPIADVVS